MCSRGAGVPPATCLESGKQAKTPMFSIISRHSWEVRLPSRAPEDGEWKGNESGIAARRRRRGREIRRTMAPIPDHSFGRELGQLATTLPKVPGGQPRPAKEGLTKITKGVATAGKKPLPATSVSPSSARSVFAPQARTGTGIPQPGFVFRCGSEACLIGIRISTRGGRGHGPGLPGRRRPEYLWIFSVESGYSTPATGRARR